MPLTSGETFAGYKIIRVLGSGGMGEVYLAQHPRLPRRDALKILRPDLSSNASFRERFIREAELAAGLRHPHIVGVHDRGEHEGQLWIAMDYIDGTDANHLMEQRYSAGMPIDLATMVITAVARALDYAHKKGVLHRDVKPGNIIVADLDGDDPAVFLADFGIARPLEDTVGITTTNMTLGTVAYAAPEQLMGESIDGRSDQYALAATAYHLLTGSQLFSHTNPAVVISRHLNTAPPKLSTGRPDLARLDDSLAAALAKEPENRYSSCAAFARSLTTDGRGRAKVSPSAATLAASDLGHSPTKTARAATDRQRFSQSNGAGSRRTLIAISGAAAIILLIGVIAFFGQSSERSGSTVAQFPSNTPQSTPMQAPVTPTGSSPTSSTSTQPPVPSTTPTSTSTTTDRADEQGFLTATGNLPMYVRPNGRYSTDADMLAFGYKACAALDTYPNDSERATRVLYPSGNQTDGSIAYDGYVFMIYSANYLCPRHAHRFENF